MDAALASVKQERKESNHGLEWMFVAAVCSLFFDGLFGVWCKKQAFDLNSWRFGLRGLDQTHLQLTSYPIAPT